MLRERSVFFKAIKDEQESKKAEQMTNISDSSRNLHDYFNGPQGYPKQCQVTDDENSTRILPVLLCAPLSVLLIPSLEESVADDSEGLVLGSVANSLMNMERLKPRSCEVLISRLLQRLASPRESSLKDLQEVAAQILKKGKAISEQTERGTENTESMKKLQNKELHSNVNLSPLARFLHSRWQGQVSRELNQT